MTQRTSLRPDVQTGAQTPQVDVAPPAANRLSGDEAVELAGRYGLALDEWQQHVLRRGLGERDDGQWASFEVGLVVARQNGKGAILLARELAGALLFGERLIIHSAHEAETARNHMLEWLTLIEGSRELRAKVSRTPMGRGSEAIEFTNGSRIRFRTRTRGGGRGLSGDLVVIDEAFELPRAALDALLPTLSARPNPQMWYASSAVDQMVHPNGVVLAALRERALSADPGRLTWCEWSAGEDDDRDDPEVWAKTNPALGIRISMDYVEAEFQSLSARGFDVERLSMGDWPAASAGSSDGLPLDGRVWAQLRDLGAAPADPVVFGVEISPDRKWASIVAAGWCGDGRVAVELIERRAGVGWVVGRVRDLVARNAPAAVAVHDAMERQLSGLDDAAGGRLLPAAAKDLADGCARLVDRCNSRLLSHLGQPDLVDAVEHAGTKRLAGGFAWKQAGPHDVSALVAATLAVWGLEQQGRSEKREPILIVT